MAEDLTPFEQWMVQSNLQRISEGAPADAIVAGLRRNGYFRVADAVADSDAVAVAVAMLRGQGISQHDPKPADGNAEMSPELLESIEFLYAESESAGDAFEHAKLAGQDFAGHQERYRHLSRVCEFLYQQPAVKQYLQAKLATALQELRNMSGAAAADRFLAILGKLAGEHISTEDKDAPRLCQAQQAGSEAQICTDPSEE